MSCIALFIAAPASGQGKTTLTAALARALTRRGKRVRIFKTGPDYLDPQVLELASNNPVLQLDLWMGGSDYCQNALYQASTEADVILVEGVMGMFDGQPSSADLAAHFGLPIVLAMDVSAMAQTAGAVVAGLNGHRADTQIAGVIANRCGSDYHASLIKESLPADIPLWFSLPRDQCFGLPERHLGLVPAFEQPKLLDQALEALADHLDSLDIESFLQDLPPCEFSPSPLAELPKNLQGKTIAVARDAAFSFIYADNLACLEDMGAQLRFFSPLRDSALPDCDSLWLPGGYPELYLDTLSNNTAMQAAISEHWQVGKKILAECGGFLYCLAGITDLAGHRASLIGLLPGEAVMRDRGGCQGMQTAIFPEGEIRAHAHHRSKAEVSLAPFAHGRRQRHSAPGEAIFVAGSLRASYLHLFFRNNPATVAGLFL